MMGDVMIEIQLQTSAIRISRRLLSIIFPTDVHVATGTFARWGNFCAHRHVKVQGGRMWIARSYHISSSYQQGGGEMFVICTYIALLVNCILSTFYVGIVIQRDGRLRHQQAQGGAHRPAERLHAGGRRQAAAPRRHRQGTSIKDFCTGEEEGFRQMQP